MSERTALITGATSGIGLALAQQLDATHRLVLVGRRPLSELTDPVFSVDSYCRCDLANPDASVVVDEWCLTHGIDMIDVLVNNAGVGWTGNVWEQPSESIRELVAVNLSAPVSLTQRLLPRVQACAGRVVFVSSVISTVGHPDLSVYAATKKALDGFVRSVRAERSTGDVSFEVIHPGATRTEMPAKVGVPEATYRKWPSAESVASSIVDGLDNKPAKNRAIGLPNVAIRAVSRRAPGAVAAIASRRSSPPTLAPSSGSNRVLITGAADGIGRALALAYAANDWLVVGVDIDEERAAETIELTPASRVQFRTVDLATSDMSWVGDEEPFDAVVHNAGISAVGSFATIDPADHQRVIDLNLVAPMLLTRALLSDHKLRQGARLIFMSSLSHQLGYPGAAVYAATKDGLELYARSVRAALHPAITTTTVFPGPTRTAHAQRYSPDPSDTSNEARRMDPAVLADQIVGFDGARLFPGPVAKASAALGTLAPSVGEAVIRTTVFNKMRR